MRRAGRLLRLAGALLASAAVVAGVARAAAADERDAIAATRELTLRVDGAERSYRLHVGRSVDAERAAPLLLVFHGGGGTPRHSRCTATCIVSPGCGK